MSNLRRSQVFLIGAGVIFLFAIALPLLFIPYSWASWFQWEEIKHSDLTTYFARCLGGIAAILSVFALYAVKKPQENLLLFHLIIAITGLMGLVHLWGLFENKQPWTEDVEVIFYLAVASLTYWCRPRGKTS